MPAKATRRAAAHLPATANSFIEVKGGDEANDMLLVTM